MENHKFKKRVANNKGIKSYSTNKNEGKTRTDAKEEFNTELEFNREVVNASKIETDNKKEIKKAEKFINKKFNKDFDLKNKDELNTHTEKKSGISSVTPGVVSTDTSEYCKSQNPSPIGNQDNYTNRCNYDNSKLPNYNSRKNSHQYSFKNRRKKDLSHSDNIKINHLDKKDTNFNVKNVNETINSDDNYLSKKINRHENNINDPHSNNKNSLIDMDKVESLVIKDILDWMKKRQSEAIQWLTENGKHLEYEQGAIINHKSTKLHDESVHNDRLKSIWAKTNCKKDNCFNSKNKSNRKEVSPNNMPSIQEKLDSNSSISITDYPKINDSINLQYDSNLTQKIKNHHKNEFEYKNKYKRDTEEMNPINSRARRGRNFRTKNRNQNSRRSSLLKNNAIVTNSQI